MGKVFKGLLKFTVAAATLGGVCYAFKDKIRETKVYQDHDMDNKIKKVTKTIKEKIPAVFDNEADYVDEDEIFFDDLDLAAEDIEREYVSIDPVAPATTDDKDSVEATTEVEDSTVAQDEENA